MSNAAQRRESRLRRHRRVRKSIVGTATRPRLAVFRSNKHLVMQVIDDETGRTLAAASTHETDVKADGGTGSVAGRLVGSPVRRSKQDPCFQHSMVGAPRKCSTSPSDSGTSSCEQRSSRA